MTYPPNAPVPPPPAAAAPVPASKAPPTGWLAVAAGVLGLLALFLPWYHPKLTKSIDALKIDAKPYHAWSGFFFLVLAPLALIVFGVLWVQALTGRGNSRYVSSSNPLRTLSVQSIGAGVVALLLALLSVPLVKSHYKDWDEAVKIAKEHGSSITRGPQVGLYLLVLGAVLLIIAGVLGLLTKPASAAASSGGFGASAGAPGGYQPQGEYAPPAGPQGEYAPPAGPQGEYAPPAGPQGGYTPPATPYTPPQGGYPPPASPEQ
jgi:hypothetical protein